MTELAQIGKLDPAGVEVRPFNGLLVINADDWGLDREATDCIADCARCRTISSTSAMVFMKDSERAASIARERSIDTGLHLNFTQAFTAASAPGKLVENHQKIAQYLLNSRIAQAIFHPALVNSFEYVVKAQLDEYRRLYGVSPDRIDGHHHMHQCANVVLQNLLPAGTLVRRNFSFQRGEKSFINRFYRQIVDRLLARRHRLVDYFFSLPTSDDPGEMRKIAALAADSKVEVAAHPAVPREYQILTRGDLARLIGDYPIAPRFTA